MDDNKIGVFVSWAGAGLSEAFATDFTEWLRKVMQGTKPWMSKGGIPAGTWSIDEIRNSLSRCEAGVLMLTRENQNRPWLHFEAGALAFANKRVSVITLDMEPTDHEGPLKYFQCNRADRDGILEVLRSINAVARVVVPDADLVEECDLRFPALAEKLEAAKAHAAMAKPAKKEVRKTDDMIREVLEVVRRIDSRGSGYRGLDYVGEGVEDLPDSLPLTVVRDVMRRRALADWAPWLERVDAKLSMSDTSDEAKRVYEAARVEVREMPKDDQAAVRRELNDLYRTVRAKFTPTEPLPVPSSKPQK